MYSAVTLNFTKNLYKYHKMEYGRHIKRIVILYIATILSSIYGIFYTGSFFYLAICVNNGISNSNGKAFFDIEAVFEAKKTGMELDLGLCHSIVDEYSEVFLSERVV